MTHMGHKQNNSRASGGPEVGPGLPGSPAQFCAGRGWLHLDASLGVLEVLGSIDPSFTVESASHQH